MQERMARCRRHRPRGDGAGFTPAAVAFLRALKRNNDREWFKARKERYESWSASR